jgi:Protein of unknown function (DUF3500)
MRSTRFLVVPLTLVLIGSACGGSDDAATDDSDTTVAGAETVAPAESSEPAASTAATEPADTTASTTADTTAATNADTTEPTTASESAGTANTAEVVAAAEALIATLSDEEVDTLMYDFGDASITSTWSNLPGCQGADNSVPRSGIQHGNLTEEQVEATLALADAVLSDEGYAEYTEIILADDYLQTTYGNTIWDSDCYFMAIYGTPSETEAFALQFGGHHFARTVTYEGGVATITPAFTGIEPSTFDVDGTTYEVMGDEMSSIFAMFTDLDETQLATAEIDGSFDDVLLGPGEDEAFPETVGLAVGELSDPQQAAVLTSIRSWVDDFDSSVADTVMATIESELSETYISWSTSTDAATDAAYARIDGPSVWIEAVNQDGLSGIHHHSVYRDKTDDYGTAV